MSTIPSRPARSRARAGGRATLETQALLSARSLVDRMRTLYRELERLTDAPITLHRALTCIGENPGLPASELATRLGMQRPAVSHVLKSLAGRGWIERRRHEGDQRSVQLHVTAEGQQILRATSGRAVGTLQRAVRHMKSSELRQLAAGLGALLVLLPPPPSERVVKRASPTAPRLLPPHRARASARPSGRA